MAQYNSGPQQWGPGRPQQPMPPQKKSNAGKIIGFGCLGVIAFFIVIGVIAAALGGGGDESAEKKPAASSAPKDSGGEKGGEKEEAPKEEAAEESPIAITAEKTDLRPTILADGEDYTSILVTVVNNDTEKVDVNPLYFEVTGADGAKYDVELAVDERQIDTVELAKGEKVTGAVTVKGTIEPKSVTFMNGLLGDTIKADVE
ncbi:DUF4352 domain-containing protein [Streptomyces macrosporus]|uniref:DUF4352 domain-containing protein n=1 Tax=Streptomyces macrosporus TaxID=44032 RepID=A0ABP5X9W5_9ACTN